MKNVVIFNREGLYGGWPANHGMWSWGDEILLSYQVCGFEIQPGDLHAFARDKDRVTWFSRSLDGGETWDSAPSRFNEPCGSNNGEFRRELLGAFSGKLDFSNPDFCLMFLQSGIDRGDMTWWIYSEDRGRSWNGPFALPDMGTPDVTSRTDCHVLDRDTMLLLMTCVKENGKEGKVFAAKLHSEGGFEFVGWLREEEPEGFEIMPTSAFRRNGELVAVTRVCIPRGEETFYTLEQYSSPDQGRTWRHERRVAERTSLNGKGGNPASLSVLPDGCWALTYGSRIAPCSIMAMYSPDEGRTWERPFPLRSDGDNWDLGYTRNAVRADGRLVCAYYFCPDKMKERTIEATIF